MIAAEYRFFRFLAQEFRPTAARWRATLRFVIAGELVMIACLATRAPEPHWALIAMLLIALIDPQASVDKAYQRIAGTVAGAGLGVVASAALWDLSGLLLIFVAIVAGAGVYLSRTQPAAYFWTMLAVTVILVMPDRIAEPDASIARGLWRAGMTLAGVVAGLLSQVLLWPERPMARLREDLADRLDRVAAVMRRIAATPEAATDAHAAALFAITPLPPLHERLAGERTLRRLGDSLRRLILALRRLEHERHQRPFTPADQAALVALAAHVARLAAAARQGRQPAPVADGDDTADPVIGPLARAVGDLQAHVAAAAAAATAALRHLPLPRRIGFVRRPGVDLPALQLAMKVSLALTLCGVLYQILLWPGLATAAVTCITLAQPTHGANLLKALLRFTGALTGAVFAFLALAAISPIYGDIVGLALAVAPLLAYSSYLVFGAPRIGYAGMQTFMPAAMVLMDQATLPLGPRPALDRVAGIFVGILVTTAIDTVLWVRSARAGVPPRLDEAERHIAALEPLAFDHPERRPHTEAARRELAAASIALGDANLELRRDRAARQDLRRLAERLHRLESRFLTATAHG
jgi:multidrug resistance protein MdtO